jgi:hypothetical protein
VLLDTAVHRVHPVSRALLDQWGQMVRVDFLVPLARMDRLGQPDLVDQLVQQERPGSLVHQGNLVHLDQGVLLEHLVHQANQGHLVLMDRMGRQDPQVYQARPEPQGLLAVLDKLAIREVQVVQVYLDLKELPDQ